MRYARQLILYANFKGLLIKHFLFLNICLFRIQMNILFLSLEFCRVTAEIQTELLGNRHH